MSSSIKHIDSLMEKRALKHIELGGWPTSGCPIFGAFFAPKVGIRAGTREPLPPNSHNH
jgi:hypothetical protein